MAANGKSLKKSRTARKLEADGWINSDPDDTNFKAVDAFVKSQMQIARAERIGVRLDPNDLQLLKDLAERRGLGYQTLLGSIIHMYVTDQLIDRDSAVKQIESMVEKVVRSRSKRISKKRAPQSKKAV